MLTRTPWWLDEAPPDPPAGPLPGDAEADVCVVGGGYTGLWTALTLRRREPSLRVVVLEAAHVGHGPSGRNGGFLETYWCALGRCRSRLGDVAALQLATASEGALAAVEELGEDVWLRRGGMLEVSTTPAQDVEVEKALRTAAELGVSGRAVEADPGISPAFRRAVRFPDAATVQPARLVRALRRQAVDAGVVLHETTRATAIGQGRVVTEHGTVMAPEIVVATNAWTTGWKPARGRLTNFGSYVVLTEPAPELLEEIGWTGGEAIVDGRMFIHYFRTTADGRVVMGSGSGPIGHGGTVGDRFFDDAPTVRRAEAGLRRLLPGLAAARVERAWGGPIDVSSDQLPFFSTVPGTRMHFGAGYSGNGVGPSWLGGQILASLALGADDKWTRLPLANRLPPRLPPEPFRYVGGAAIRHAILTVEEADEAGRSAGRLARGVAALPKALGLRVGTR